MLDITTFSSLLRFATIFHMYIMYSQKLAIGIAAARSASRFRVNYHAVKVCEGHSLISQSSTLLKSILNL